MNALITALGYTLLHFVWEAAVLALPLALFRGSSRMRYRIACAVLFAMPVAFGVTLLAELPAQFGAYLVRGNFAALQAAGNHGTSTLQQPFLARFAEQGRWFVPLWLAGVCAFYLRGAGSWLMAQRLRRSASHEIPAWCADRMNRIASALRIPGAIALLESCKVDSPVVIGFLRPAILFPAGVLTALPVEQVECLLIHELSHIRRADYLINLLQTAVEGLLFYHPLVWWTSGVVRTERENCCDDAVLAMCPDALGYARTLATLEQNRWETAQAASGGNLAKRIRRVLGRPRKGGAATSPLLSIALLGISLAAGVASISPLAAQAPAQQTESSTARWVKEDVAYIISNAERAAYNNLTSDEEREHFIEQFWARRAPGAKEEHYRRIAYANQHFSAAVPGWKTDMGRIYITFGPPDEIDSHTCLPGHSAFEDWKFRVIPGIGTNVSMRFEDTACSGEYRMTRDPQHP